MMWSVAVLAGPLLHLDDRIGELVPELRPFALAGILGGHVCWTATHGPFDPSELVSVAVQLASWWVWWNKRDDDDQWKRRRRKALARIRQMASGRLVVAHS